MDLLFTASLLLGFSIICRIIPRVIWKTFHGSDIHYHYFLIREIKENKYKIPYYTDRVLAGPTESSYPAYYHAFLARLPWPFIQFFDRYGALIFDLFAGGLIAAILFFSGKLSPGLATLSLAIYLILPSLTFSALGPRAYSLTARSFAQAIATIGLVSLVMAQMAEGWACLAWGALSILAFSLVFLSSQFGSQHLFFVLLLSIPLGGGWHSALALSAALLVALALGQQRFIFQIKGQFKHLEWYFNLGMGFVKNRGDWVRLIRGILGVNVRIIAGEFLFHNPLLVGITRSLPFFLALYISFENISSLANRGVFSLLLGSALAWLITSFGVFRVLGEAERYLEFSIGLAWFGLLNFLGGQQLPLWMFAIGVFSLAFCLLNFFILRLQLGGPEADSLGDVANYLESVGAKVLLCLNNSESYYFLNKTNLNIVGFNCNASIRDGHEIFFRTFFSVYPKVSAPNLEKICADNSVDYVLMNRSATTDANGIPYDFTRMCLVLENRTHVLFRT
ncbi:hypothetical protein HCX48_10265 [Rhodocyclus tenuis]|uniref:Glycosyltransferase RgtA/B/C/D-like domain-containing protein n=1 Tax=Rhodocyclus gracilis TaxID=2929842 RepID=A0ABX0WIQ9_9RHOO|nr:hypothetical protein [Rhodocyclus gracilis]MRD72306.1 hypothetical protein [Rhodocyclus gracilis]NJA89605.1 hypothetical protein [Rhodocyclus gracilis]